MERGEGLHQTANGCICCPPGARRSGLRVPVQPEPVGARALGRGSQTALWLRAAQRPAVRVRRPRHLHG